MNRMIATWFGTGYLPVAPGTWGTLAALPPAIAIDWLGGPHLLFLSAALLFLLGEQASTRWLGAADIADRPEIVVDEVVGLWFTLSAADGDPLLYACGFALVRMFDIVKPGPVSWADRQVPGAFGIMLDDVLAAGYAFLGVFLLNEVLGP